MMALGFIETQGLLAAIEAADAMVKAADVQLIEKNLIGAGLVTITVGGEVSAVNAAVDAAVTAVERIDMAALISRNVIARPYDEISHIIATEGPSTESATRPVIEGEVEASVETEVQHAEKATTPIEAQEDAIRTPVVKNVLTADELDQEPAVEDIPTTATGPTEKPYRISELRKLTVSKLRQIALGLSENSLTSAEIKTATKKKLIEAILDSNK